MHVHERSNALQGFCLRASLGWSENDGGIPQLTPGLHVGGEVDSLDSLFGWVHPGPEPVLRSNATEATFSKRHVRHVEEAREVGDGLEFRIRHHFRLHRA